MLPYYDHAGITIYHGDCREILPTLANVDAVITDPPYGIGVARRTFGSGRINKGSGLCRPGQAPSKDFGDSDWDDAPVASDLLDIVRASAPQQIIFGGNYFDLPPASKWIVWDKRNDGTAFADAELAWTNLPGAVRIFRWRWNGLLQEHAGRNKELRVHPAMKPLELMKFCIQKTKGDTILDPFMGSGTTLVAAKNLGRKAIGIELEEKYCEAAAKRLAQEVMEFA